MEKIINQVEHEKKKKKNNRAYQPLSLTAHRVTQFLQL